jgi:hypothetical protein
MSVSSAWILSKTALRTANRDNRLWAFEEGVIPLLRPNERLYTIIYKYLFVNEEGPSIKTVAGKCR